MGLWKLNAFCAGLFLSALAVLVARPATAETVYEQARAACAGMEGNQRQHMQCVRDQMQARTPTPQQGPALSGQTPQYNRPANSQLRTRRWAGQDLVLLPSGSGLTRSGKAAARP